MRHRGLPWRAALVGTVALGTAISFAGMGLAGTAGHVHAHAYGFAVRQERLQKYLSTHNLASSSATIGSPLRSPDADLADSLDAYNFERTAPAGYLLPGALANATQAAAALPEAGGQWQQFTNKPDNAQPSNYTDPNWGNQGAGFSTVSGRVTALATTPDGTWFAGTADGGVWRSYDQGQTWKAVFDSMPTLSIGAIAVDPRDGSVWVGTGEANESTDSYAGTGVYRSFNDGRSWQRVGDDSSGNNPIDSHTVYRIAFTGRGVAYAATNSGLFRYSPRSGQWTQVLGATVFPPYDWQVTDVAVVPGTNGHDVIAAIGWHGPGNTENNGFYESTDRGHTFSKVTITGAINASDQGRTTFAYSADGTRLYAVVQSLSALATGQESVLQGVFVSTGSPASVAGPWTLIGDENTLGCHFALPQGCSSGTGSALPVGSGYGVGVQAWYNSVLTVDPNDPNHVYLGLEEVFQSNDGGSTWTAVSPYWNYNFACDATNPPTCPNVTHPDQHAAMVTDGKVVIGNDGGVYSRPLSDTGSGDWSDLNATLRTLQFYDARAGSVPGGTAVFGGMQDNGSSITTNTSAESDEAAGGDGFSVVVDPQNGNNIAGEYTDGTLYSSTDGGHTFLEPVSPTCVAQSIFLPAVRPDCDPSARFWTPFVQDQQNPNTWLIGGRYVWVSTSGWTSTCTDTACSWTPVFDTGAGNSVTALTSANNGSIIYAAWVTSGNPGPSFNRGVATNYGGTWHQLSMTGLPLRYIAGVTVDPSNPAHAYVIFNGYSRRFVPGGGVGHVFETWDGGSTWTDISGNLPDIASDTLVLSGGRLALATDAGVFTALEGQGANTSWSRLGEGLPNVVVDDLTQGPNGYIYAATHGRGVWRIRFGGHDHQHSHG
jgi:hypothetical protein